MSTNKEAKEKLIELFGAQCFIEKLHLRPDTERRYTSKGQLKRMKQLTYHHIKERFKGGKASLANGALLSFENHQWFNKQPPEIQRILNQAFQRYKEQHSTKCEIEMVDNLELGIDVRAAIIKIDSRGKVYNRAREKREFQRNIRDYYEER